MIAEFGASFDVTRPVGELSPAERAVVAIARALDGWQHTNNVLVLDEPTASLHRDEVAKLFTAVRQVASRGAGVIFISHRLDELFEIADRILVLRDGRLIADLPRPDFDYDRIVDLIAGGIGTLRAHRADPQGRGALLLRARGLVSSTVRSLNLDLHAGEIVGIGGVLGSGREEIAPTLFGADVRADSNRSVRELSVAGRPLARHGPALSIAAGMGYVPADRHKLGAVMTMSLRENLTLPMLRPLRGRLGRIDRGAEDADTKRWISDIGVRPATPERPLNLFSGGNQQKVVIAKWLRTQPRVLLLDEPAQGVDVGAKAGIFELLRRAADAGTAILVTSSDEKDLVALCDRVLVMCDGEVAAELSGNEITEARIVSAGLALPIHRTYTREDPP